MRGTIKRNAIESRNLSVCGLHEAGGKHRRLPGGNTFSSLSYTSRTTFQQKEGCFSKKGTAFIVYLKQSPTGINFYRDADETRKLFDQVGDGYWSGLRKYMSVAQQLS
jgi:hypothetical protein